MGSHDTLTSTRNLVTGMLLLGGLLAWLMVAALQDPMRAYRAWYTVHLPDVSGLAVGNPVRLHGSPCGAVAGLSVVGKEAKLTLRLDDSISLHEGAAVQLRAKTPLGGRYLELYPGDRQAPRLTPGARLQAATQPIFPEDMAESLVAMQGETDPLVLMDQSRQALVRLAELGEHLRRLAPASRQALRLFGELSSLVGEVQRQAQALGQLPAEQAPRLAALLPRVERVHERLSEIAAALEVAGEATDGRLSARAGELEAHMSLLGERVQHSLEREGQLLERLETALEGLLVLDELLLRRLFQQEGLSALGACEARRVRERIRQLEQEAAQSPAVSP